MSLLLMEVLPSIAAVGADPPPIIPPPDLVGTEPMGLAIGVLILIAAVYLLISGSLGKKRATWSFSPRSSVFMDLLGIGAAFGSLLGTDATTGGFIAGAIFLGAMVFVGMVIASHLEGMGSMYGMVTFLGIGIGIPAAFGWFPNWFLIFVLMLVVALVLTSRANSGGP